MLVVGILVASVVERVGTKEKGEEGEEGRGREKKRERLRRGSNPRPSAS